MNHPKAIAPDGASAEPSPAGGRARVDARKSRNAVVAMVAIAAIAIIGVVIWWQAGLRNRFFPDNFGVVEPGKIYRSAQIHPRILARTLRENHIAVIVDLAHETTWAARSEREIAERLGIEQYHCTLAGNGTGNPRYYVEAIERIAAANREGKAVLVHCQSGAERTGGVIAVYRMLVQGVPKDKAFEETTHYHHNPHSNPQLYPYVEQHLAEWRRQLEADHVPLAGTKPQCIGVKVYP